MRLRKGFALSVLGAMLGLLVVVGSASANPIAVKGVDFDYFRLPPSDHVPGVGDVPSFKWGPATYGTPGGNVSYSYMAGGTACGFLTAIGATVPGFPCITTTALGGFLPLGFAAATDAAFAAWSAAGNITFTNVADGGQAVGSAGPAQIRIGGYNIDGPSGILAFAFFPSSTGGPLAEVRGDVFFDSSESWSLVDPGPGFNYNRVGAHEIGHSLGLGHSELTDALMFAFYQETIPLGLRPDDINGIMYIYGPQPQVPEPTTLVLLGLGLGLVAFARRRAR